MSGLTRGLCGQRTGVGIYATNLIDALVDVDPEISVLLVSTEPILSILPFLDGRVREVVRTAGSRNNFVWTNVSLRRAVAENNIDLFHSPGYTRPLGFRIPSIVTLHDVCYAAAPQWYPYSSGFLRQAWYRLSATGANAIITVSEFSRREIIRVYQVPADSGLCNISRS